MKKSLATIAIALAASLSLTACDPPMPPEVLASLAEQTYTCETGDTQLAAIPVVAAVAADWQMGVEMNCPGMTITPVEVATDATALQIHESNQLATGSVFSSVPFAVDAVVLAASLPDITNVNLSASVIEKISLGQITNWSDPAIAELNSSFEMPDLAIAFGSELTATEALPLASWLSRLLSKNFEFGAAPATLEESSDGSLVLTKFSRASEFTSTMVAIVTKETPDGVIPAGESITTAATMFKGKSANGILALTFDPKATPIAPDGINEVPAPYEAVSIIALSLVGEDTLATRAAARYVLRQDSQGSLGLSYVLALPESLRAIALAEVSKGLPMPTLAPEGN